VLAASFPGRSHTIHRNRPALLSITHISFRQ
jgi:hypothetical protein